MWTRVVCSYEGSGLSIQPASDIAVNVQTSVCIKRRFIVGLFKKQQALFSTCCFSTSTLSILNIYMLIFYTADILRVSTLIAISVILTYTI